MTYLADFLNYYNTERNHSGIGYNPPISRVPVKTHRVEPQEFLPSVDTTEFRLQDPLF